MTKALTAALLLLPALAQACEGCKSSAQDNGSPNAIGEAFGYSIYFMLLCPFVIVGGMIWVGLRQFRRLEQERALGTAANR